MKEVALKQKSISPKQKSISPKNGSASSEKTLYYSPSPKQKSPSPKPKKSILKKPKKSPKPESSPKPKKKLLFNDFIHKAEAHTKEYYDRRSVPKMVLTKENVKELKRELNELMDSLYIHPDSKKYTKRY
jgi:hypothetical protein